MCLVGDFRWIFKVDGYFIIVWIEKYIEWYFLGFGVVGKGKGGV